MLFAAINSGLWVVEKIKHPWPELNLFTIAWLSLLLCHLLFVIIKKPDSTNDSLLKEE